MQILHDGGILELLGTINRIPGRLLVAEDEFMKGILFQNGVRKNSSSKYNKHLQLKNQMMLKVQKKELSDPSYPNNATRCKRKYVRGKYSKRFTRCALKNLQSFMNIPEVKLFVPFYKTVTNIFLESSKRNPFTAWLMPTVRDLKGLNGPAKETISSSKNY